MPEICLQIVVYSRKFVCGQTVKGLWKKAGKLYSLYSKSTGSLKYLTSQVFFIPGFHTNSTRPRALFAQPDFMYFNLVIGFFNLSSTTPTNKTII